MSSSHSSTHTSTYTVADVEKVVRNIKADLMMIADRTRAMTEDQAKEYAHDIELLAKKGFLTSVDVTLMSAAEAEAGAYTYDFQSDGATRRDRPGGVDWPATPTGRVRIVMSATDTFWARPEEVAKLPLKINWVSSSADTSHGTLKATGGRGYSSNGYGANRNDFA